MKITGRFSTDLRSILFEGPGIEACKGTWSARFTSGGVARTLASENAKDISISPARWLRTPFGDGVGEVVVAEDKSLGVRLEMTICGWDAVDGFMMQARLTNIGDAPLTLDSFTLLQTGGLGGEMRLAGDPRGWTATAALGGQIPVTLNRIGRQAWFGSALDLMHDGGTGFSIGPARRVDGVKLNVMIGPVAGASVPMRIDSSMGQGVVNPGESRISDQVIVLMAAPIPL